MIQLILHLSGDYLTQSDWMAQNKTKAYFPAFVHALVYSLPFLCLTTHVWALACIFGTHFLIDRFRLARYVVWAKNWLGPNRLETMTEALERAKAEGRVSSSPVFADGELSAFLASFKNERRTIRPTLPFAVCSATGYPPDRPMWMSVWLLIIADNTMHLAINYAALRWL